MSITPFPFEEVQPSRLAKIPPVAAPETSSLPSQSPSQEPGNGQSSPDARSHAKVKVEDRAAKVTAIEANPRAKENSPKSAAGAEQSGTQAIPVAPQASAVAGTKPATSDLLEFYGLKQQPFDVTPDPAYLYFTPSHREALTSLSQGVEHFRGFMMLVAEPGMGKTTLLNKLMEELSNSARVVFLFQTQCSSSELLSYILNELEVDHTGMDAVAMHRALNQALLEEMLRGQRFVLIVDEAQNLSEPVLETIRLLSDFETTHSKLIQIVLAGQPQLADSLMKDGLVQLRQRVAVLANLKPLSALETSAYVEHRLRAAGWHGTTIFTSDAMKLIAESSGGIPRTINNLCFNALLVAFRRGHRIVGAGIVKEVAETLNVETLVRRPRPEDAAARQIEAADDRAGMAELARVLAAALNAQAKPEAKPEAKIEPKPRFETVLAGNLVEKSRSQGWDKRHEYRIMFSLERETFSGSHIADRYYCSSFYVSEEQAAALKPGKPVRIRIEQD